MDAKLGSRLAQLANARKQADALAELTPEDLERIEAEKAVVHMQALQRILQPHVDEFNAAVDDAMRITLETKPPVIGINQSYTRLLTVELTPKAARFKRRGDNYTSDDYFTITPDSTGAMTFGRYAASVEKPMDAGSFAEHILMEALGLNE